MSYFKSCEGLREVSDDESYQQLKGQQNREFLFMLRIFIYINTVSDTHTYAPKRKDTAELQNRNMQYPKLGGKCPFFSTVLQKGSNQFSTLTSLLSVFLELGSCHGNHKMEAVIDLVCLREDFCCEAVCSQSLAPHSYRDSSLTQIMRLLSKEWLFVSISLYLILQFHVVNRVVSSVSVYCRCYSSSFSLRLRTPHDFSSQ